MAYQDNIPTFQGAGWVNQDRPDFASIDNYQGGGGQTYVGYQGSPQLFSMSPQPQASPAMALLQQRAYSGQQNYGQGMAPVMPGMQIAQAQQPQMDPQSAANSNLATYLRQKYINQPGQALDMDSAVQGIQSDPVLSQLGGVQRMATVTSALGQSPQAYATGQFAMQQKRAELATALLGQQKAALDLQQQQQSFPTNQANDIAKSYGANAGDIQSSLGYRNLVKDAATGVYRGANPGEKPDMSNTLSFYLPAHNETPDPMNPTAQKYVPGTYRGITEQDAAALQSYGNQRNAAMGLGTNPYASPQDLDAKFQQLHALGPAVPSAPAVAAVQPTLDTAGTANANTIAFLQAIKAASGYGVSKMWNLGAGITNGGFGVLGARHNVIPTIQQNGAFDFSLAQ